MIGVLLREARSRCIQCFDVYEFAHCRRDCNTVALSLAQLGFRADAECSGWAHEASPFVSNLVANDIAVHRG
jgi:hypothetical protein